MPTGRNILILHSGALGDVVLAVPLVLALARVHPQSRTVFVSHSQKARLVSELVGVEHADLEAGWGSLFSDAPLQNPALRWLEGAHTVVSFLGAGAAWRNRVKSIAPSEVRLIELDTRPPADWTQPLARWWISCLRETPVIAAALEAVLSLLSNRGLSLPGRQVADRDRVVIHPGSGGVAKWWPVEKYAALASALKASGRHVVFAVGEAETERWGSTGPAGLLEGWPVERPASPLDLARLLASAGQYVGNDSGPSHLAGVLGVPTLALFGPTDERVWRPPGPAVQTIRHEPLEGLSVDAVARAVGAG